jgi:hypothetical protein
LTPLTVTPLFDDSIDSNLQDDSSFSSAARAGRHHVFPLLSKVASNESYQLIVPTLHSPDPVGKRK